MHSSVIASFVSDSEELTDRHPCQFIQGRPYVKAEFKHKDGIAEHLVLWCADCGEPLGECRLLQLLVFEGDVTSTVPLPLVLVRQERGRA